MRLTGAAVVALLVMVQAPTPPPSGIPKLVSAVLPEQCQAARERGAQLRGELETTLSPQDKAAAEQYVAKPGPGVSPQKAWGDYAAGAFLMGNRPVAAWAGLKAVDIQWTPETVTNAGVYLYQLGKVQEALQLLNCAYAMGWRSAYLLEALAVAEHKTGDLNDARQKTRAFYEDAVRYLNTPSSPPPGGRR